MKRERITLAMLIEAGIIQPPMKIYATFRGTKFEATIDRDGFVVVKGLKRYTSLSLAAGYIRADMSGKPRTGTDYRPSNGWTFWKYRHPSGDMRKVDDLRQQWQAS